MSESLSLSSLGVVTVDASAVKNDLLKSVAAKQILEQQQKIGISATKMEAVRKRIERVMHFFCFLLVFFQKTCVKIVR